MTQFTYNESTVRNVSILVVMKPICCFTVTPDFLPLSITKFRPHFVMNSQKQVHAVVANQPTNQSPEIMRFNVINPN